MRIRKFLAVLLAAGVFGFLMGNNAFAADEPSSPDSGLKLSDDWVAGLEQAKDVSQLFIIAGVGQTTAYISMHEKGADGQWHEVMSTPGFIGRNGLGKTKEGDGKTPLGTYSFNAAFGIQPDPGCALSYRQVTGDDFWSGDVRDGYKYNQMVSLKDFPGLDKENSERIADYTHEYAYCLNISYNAAGTPGDGSAIFLHCLGAQKPFTGGCVAIPMDKMIRVMKTVRPDCRVVIDTVQTLCPDLARKWKLPVAMNKTSIPPLVGTAAEYSAADNWMLRDTNPQHPVDVFYLYPTSVPMDCPTDVSPVTADMKKAAMKSYLKSASAFSSYANVYAPYYRQVSIKGILKAKTSDEMMNMCQDSVVRTDVFAALEYFFDHLNNGRPFILAAHSQGSCNMKLVLSQYMAAHPDVYKRMIACYAIGYDFPESWFAANSHVKKAAGETDTGVLITWNTEGPGCTDAKVFFGAGCTDAKSPVGTGGTFVINPLNWKTDETPAGVDQNLGSAQVDDNGTLTIVPGKADAVIDRKRSSIVCSTSADYLNNQIFGQKSFHLDDWALYYGNIRENGKKRIQAYFDSHK